MSTLDIKQDLQILTAMVSHLTPYLYENELFGEIEKRMPKLTVGGILLRLNRLQGLWDHLSSEQQSELHAAREQFEKMRYEWQSHYQDKILREIRSRINSMKWFLDDCANNPGTCEGGWPNEAEKRTMIAYLAQEAERLNLLGNDLRAEIAALDSRLRGYHRSGAFLWDARLQETYPRDQFWWLYSQTA